jgi:hypothetical protein
MRYRLCLSVALVLLCSPLSAGAEDKYICLGEHMAGFTYNTSSKSWESAEFKAVSHYVISTSEDEIYPFTVSTVGDDCELFRCREGFTDAGFLYCQGTGGEFRFNRKNKRFLRTYPFGYIVVLPEWKVTDEESHSPFIEIGTCTPF